MTAKLANPLIDQTVDYTNPADTDRFFNESDRRKILKGFYDDRERFPNGPPYYGCQTNLFFGFFFDGTRNNYVESLKRQDHTFTNVARLYDAYPGQSVPGVLPSSTEWAGKNSYKNFYRVYVPGVGTPFKEVSDSGEGSDALFGNACAKLGERRIIWALVQAVNCLHRFFRGANLIDAERALTLCKDIRLGWDYLQARPNPHWATDSLGYNKHKFKELLLELRKGIAVHIPDKAGGKPKQMDPGKVETIFVSAFGFSRGAAEARVFSSWLVELCRLDAAIDGRPGLTLGGFPVTFDFLGVFDTVASVGLASSTLFGDGHASWADAEVSLRIPPDVKKCLHLVAAHEVRRSFPVDSIHIKGTLSEQCEEIIFPGVHSDVGGGYQPREQGRGQDARGDDMLSRISLAIMYRAARLAGVPLKLELAGSEVKDRFRISPIVIRAFNAYLAQCRTTRGSLTEIMREQRRHYVLWRKQMIGKMATLSSVQRCLPEDQADILGADQELAQEIAAFQEWRQHKVTTHYTGRGGAPIKVVATPPGWDPHHLDEWRLIDRFWDEPAPHPDIQALFNEYVHDSFAWFKITGIEAADLNKEMKRLIALKAATEWNKIHHGRGARFARSLTPEQERWVDEYRRTGQYAPAMTTGREPALMGAGYLRFRKVYAGADNWLLTKNDSLPDEGQGRLSAVA